jgi:hypothetical protein
VKNVSWDIDLHTRFMRGTSRWRLYARAVFSFARFAQSIEAAMEAER